MNNLERSEIVIATILGLLMERGLAVTTVRFADLHLEDSFCRFFLPCVKWLQDEGIIRAASVTEIISPIGDAQVVEPVLTAHGFVLMGKPVTIGDSQTTVGEAMKMTAENPGLLTRWGDFVGAAAGGLMKSLGSG